MKFSLELDVFQEAEEEGTWHLSSRMSIFEKKYYSIDFQK